VKATPPASSLQSERVRGALGWQPRFDDLSLIVTDALEGGASSWNGSDAATDAIPITLK